MSKFDWAKVDLGRGGGSSDDTGSASGNPPRKGPPPISRRPSAAGKPRLIAAFLLSAAIVYGGYFWFVRRIVVGPGQVMVLLKKDGSRAMSGDQIIIPRAPDQKIDASGYEQWRQTYGDVNGILEQVYPEGTYFGFSPFDYERERFEATVVASGKVGVVVKKFGEKLDPQQVLADPSRNQR